VIFSDHHKGRRDGADDFWICERAYNAALGYYLERGHELFVLGDAEELWENDPKPVLEKYWRTLELEGEFHAHGRYTRFFGNHDLEWRRPDHVANCLQPLFDDVATQLGPPAEPRPVKVLEATKLILKRGGKKEGLIFLFHGHQGTPLSDYLAWASEPLVRHGWRRIQRRRGLPSTSPARNYNLREEHERAAASGRSDPVRHEKSSSPSPSPDTLIGRSSPTGRRRSRPSTRSRQRTTSSKRRDWRTSRPTSCAPDSSI
jgi:hypothetical protein